MAQAQQAYHYTVRQSGAVLVLRLLALQVAIGLASVLATLELQWLATTTRSSFLIFAVHPVALTFQTLDMVLVVLLVLEWARTSYIITPQEVILEYGLLQPRRRIYKTSAIESIEAHQSWLGKLLNYGTVTFYSPRFEQTVHLANIPDPFGYSEIIQKSIHNESQTTYVGIHKPAAIT